MQNVQVEFEEITVVYYCEPSMVFHTDLKHKTNID